MTPNMTRLGELEAYLNQMSLRGLSEEHGTPYAAPDAALAPRVMYFAPLMCAPSDRREVARWIIGSQAPEMQSPYNRACNIFATFFFGPSAIYHTLSGKASPADAWVDFERVETDPQYVQEIADNIAYARLHGHTLWTTTELHTSLQTAARNFCRIKHDDPERKPQSTDLIEWIASWISTGHIDKVLTATSLRGCYDAITSMRGVGPYYGGNPVMMIASMPEVIDFSHDEPFCAPGGGCIKTLEYLYDQKLGFDKAIKAIAYIREHQRTLMPNLYVPTEFQNLDLHYGKLFRQDQTEYTCNSFEVGMCQFSVYRKFLEDPAAIERRLNPAPFDPEPFAARERGEPMVPTKLNKTPPAAEAKTSLLSFD